MNKIIIHEKSLFFQANDLYKRIIITTHNQIKTSIAINCKIKY